MPKFLFQASYESEGVRGLVREGAASRRATIESLVGEIGGRLETFYFAFGEVDVYLIVDLPDSVAASALALAVNQSGAVKLSTTVLMSPDEVDQAIARKIGYRAPGQ
jgi:uncharacterized protein with GYD domain